MSNPELNPRTLEAAGATTSTRIHLKDIDNRGDDGTPYEFIGTPEQVAGYIDGPLRRDMAFLEHRLDELLALLNAKIYTTSVLLAQSFGIYLHPVQLEGDDINVMSLGEDGDLWLVMGTTDAWAAENAVRAHYRYETGEDMKEWFGENNKLSIALHHNLKWMIGGREPSKDEDDRLAFWAIPEECFSGFLVTA